MGSINRLKFNGTILPLKIDENPMVKTKKKKVWDQPDFPNLKPKS